MLALPALILRSGPILDWDFRSNRLPPGMTISRSSGATDGMYTDATGTPYTTYAANTPRWDRAGRGLIFEQTRTNIVLNSTSPTSGTVTCNGIDTWVCWMLGSGSVTVTAGTAVATGYGVATAGTPVAINVTTVGTINLTVSGSVERLQVERVFVGLGDPSTFIVTAGTAVTRANEWAVMPLPTTAAAALAVTAISTDFSPASGPGSRIIAAIGTSDGSSRYTIRIVGAAVGPSYANTGAPVGGGPAAGSYTRFVPFVFCGSTNGANGVQSMDRRDVAIFDAPYVTGKTHLLIHSSSVAGAGQGCRMIVQRVRVWNRALYPAEMRELQL